VRLKKTGGPDRARLLPVDDSQVDIFSENSKPALQSCDDKCLRSQLGLHHPTQHSAHQRPAETLVWLCHQGRVFHDPRWPEGDRGVALLQCSSAEGWDWRKNRHDVIVDLNSQLCTATASFKAKLGAEERC
jgi:hypothetical protein